MIIKLDTVSDVPIYLQLRNQIVKGIAQGQLKEGDTLPSVRALAESLGVNMHTVHKAYILLKEEGYLYLDRRRGAVITLSPCDKIREMERINRNMEMLVAQAICKEISKDEITEMIEELFRIFN